MGALVIIDIDVTDPVKYEEYKKLAAPTVFAHGGRYVVRGGRNETLEGDWKPGRVVVLEFPNYDTAKRWWACEQYREVKAMRHASARSRMIVVEGT